jgi:cellulose synthase/poly-beta-1,6-N-acetylglucosamine synthase-like glycosyltransferase
MPRVSPSERVFRYSDSVVFAAIAVVGRALRFLFVLGLVLGFLRVAAITVLAFAQKRRRAPEGPAPAFNRRISILVPAYNEEKVIARTVESLLASTYPDFEIIVIDDGSKDATFRVVSERFAGEPRVRAFSKPNGGKAEALAFGLARADGQIIIGLDADTIFPPEVLGELVRPFADPRVAAVAGNAKVGNRINLVTRWQALEYIASQNLDRRAFALLNCITVVPGAVGAWRRDVLESLGGFASDTLAEDQDLTIQVLRRGHRVAYAERAIAWTEAPDTLAALAKQRFRWSFGTLQCMWKHRAALFREGMLGFVAMPNVWVFQILFPLLAPLVDLLLVGALVWAGLDRLEHPAAQAMSDLAPVLFYYALFLVVDWASAAVAFVLERGEQWTLLGWFLLQRIGYRQVMYRVLIRSVAAALRGGLVGWGKLERKATVKAA